MLDFLRDNVVLVLTIVALPLIVDAIKRRWDRQNEAIQLRRDKEDEGLERRLTDFRQRQQTVLAKRQAITDNFVDIYMRWMIDMRFLVLDADQDRLNSDIGRQHAKAYDENAKECFAEGAKISLNALIYFDRMTALNHRLETIQGYAGAADSAVTRLVENPPDDLTRDEMHRRWRLIEEGLGIFAVAYEEVALELAAEVKPDADYSDDEISWKADDPTDSFLAANPAEDESP